MCERCSTCPYCGKTVHADFVDIGVGNEQVSPYTCECGAVQIGPYAEVENWSDDMKRTGWHPPEDANVP